MKVLGWLREGFVALLKAPGKLCRVLLETAPDDRVLSDEGGSK